jgi:hypothetical protein
MASLDHHWTFGLSKYMAAYMAFVETQGLSTGDGALEKREI